MAYALFQSGTGLQVIDDSGTITSLTLPTSVTLSATQNPRFAVFDRFIVMVNSPSRPLLIDEAGLVRPLTIYPPNTPLTLTASGGGVLTGAYKAKQTFAALDSVGNTIIESDFGPAMVTAVTATANFLTVGGINLYPSDSLGTVNAVKIYRTLAGGEVYFLWRTLDAGSGISPSSSDTDDLTDLSLSVFTAPTLGTCPDLYLITEWRGRLWGVSRTNQDVLRYTEAGSLYQWSTDNAISVPRLGNDTRGVAGFITRRDSLMIGRRSNIQQITGTSNRDFRLVKVTDEVGIESQESVVVYKDVAFWLWKDGVYTLDANGVTCISDKGNVRSWFQTDNTFNRSRFQYAQATMDPTRLKYRLFLSAAGSSVIDRWVEYDLQDGTWWGPHKTGAFTPVCAITVPDSNDAPVSLIGESTGYFYKEQSTATDGTATSIDFDVDTGFLNQGDPNVEKWWGRLALLGKVQTAGTLAVTAYVGFTNAAAKLVEYYQMTLGRQLMGQLGKGRLVKFNFRHNGPVGEPVELYGMEVDDVHEVGEQLK